VFRTVGDQVSLWEAVLPPQVLKLPDELARVDALLDDPAFFTPFVPFFDLRIGAAGQGGRSETVAHQPSAGRHDGGAGKRDLSHRFGVAGQGGAADRGDLSADPGRRRRGAHPGPRPVTRGGQARPRGRVETALARRRGPRRGHGRGAQEHR